MSFWEHFEELRKRLTFVAIAVALATVVSMLFIKDIWSFLLLPLPAAKDLTLINVAPMEAIMMDLKVALFTGVLVAFPMLVLQTYRFLAPALYKQEKKLLWPLILSSTFFLLGGASFCFFVVLPMSFKFLQAYSADVAQQTWTQSNYIGFVLRLIMSFSILFQLPVVCYFLAKLGLITHTFLIQQFRIAIVVIFLIAALLTPPEVISQMLLAFPLLLLYGLSILVVKFTNKGAPNA